MINEEMQTYTERRTRDRSAIQALRYRWAGAWVMVSHDEHSPAASFRSLGRRLQSHTIHTVPRDIIRSQWAAEWRRRNGHL